jgi:hypothetical protein
MKRRNKIWRMKKCVVKVFNTIMRVVSRSKMQDFDFFHKSEIWTYRAQILGRYPCVGRVDDV